MVLSIIVYIFASFILFFLSTIWFWSGGQKLLKY